MSDAAPSRRDVLQGGAVAAAAGVAGFVAYTARGEGPRGPSAYGSGGAGGDQGGAGEGGGGSAVLARLDDVPAGGGVVLPDARVVLVRDGDTVRGFSATCTHAGCLVSEVSGGGIRCTCHGSVFDAATGAPVGGPAGAPLTEVAVRVEGTDVVAG